QNINFELDNAGITLANALTLKNGGALTLLANGNITQNSGAPITLLGSPAGNASIQSTSNTGVITLNDAITSAGGDVIISGKDAITLAGTGSIFTGNNPPSVPGGNISITSTNLNALGTSVTINGTLNTNTGSGGTLSVSAGVALNTTPFVGTGNITLNGNGLDLTLGALLLTGNTSFSALRNIFVNGNIVDTAGNFSLTSNTGALSGKTTLNANITANDINLLGGPTVLGVGTVTLTNNSGGTTTFANTLDATTAGAQSLVVSGNAVFGNTVGNGIALNNLSVSGTTDINGASINTTGNQIYTGPTTLSADTILNATNPGSAITFGNTLNGLHSLQVNANTTNFNGTVGNLNPLTSLAISNIANVNTTSIHTSATQNYAGQTNLLSDSTLTGSTLTFNKIDGNQTLVISGNPIFNAAIGSITPLNNLTISGATLDVTLPSTQLNNNLAVTTNGQILQSGALSIGGTSHFTSTGDLILLNNASNHFVGKVALSTPAGKNVTVSTDSNGITLDTSSIGNNLSVTSANGAIAQFIGSTLFVGGTASFNAGANAITLTNTGNNLIGAVSLSNSGATNDTSLFDNANLVIDTTSIGRNLSLASNGTISQTLASTITSQGLTLTAVGGINLPNFGLIQTLNTSNTGGGDITFNNLSPLLVQNISQTGGGLVAISNLGALTMAGNIVTDGGSIFISGANAVTLNNTGNIQTTGGNVTISSANAGSISPAVLIQGNINTGLGVGGSLLVGHGVELDQAPVIGAGSVILDGASGNNIINTSSLSGTDISFTGPTVLQQDVTFNNNSGGTTSFLNTLDGAHSILINGNADFENNVGVGTALNSIHVTGTTDDNAPQIKTTAAQTYDGAVTLTVNSILNGTNITFGNSINAAAPGAEGLTINNSGSALFNGAVGNINPLSFLAVNGPSTISGGVINTSGIGGQTFSGQVTLGNNTILTGANAGPLNINAGISGPTFTLAATQFTNIAALNVNGGVVTQALTLGGGSGTLFGTINGQPGQGSLAFITLLFGSGPFTFNGFSLNPAPPPTPTNSNIVPSSVSTNSWTDQMGQYNDYLYFLSIFGDSNYLLIDRDSLFATQDQQRVCVGTGSAQRCAEASLPRKMIEKH
ncbi:MAG: S-layer family protein, partial [Proteobacteria bacterium]|nr:S-layer family protein [Pseudomonadota bacterium]